MQHRFAVNFGTLSQLRSIAGIAFGKWIVGKLLIPKAVFKQHLLNWTTFVQADRCIQFACRVRWVRNRRFSAQQLPSRGGSQGVILPDKLLSREAIKLYFCCWDYYDCVKILSRKIFYWFLISFFLCLQILRIIIQI